jgi:hypothetical protein
MIHGNLNYFCRSVIIAHVLETKKDSKITIFELSKKRTSIEKIEVWI